MRLESVFHFSFYFTLALASACLALPTTFFLSWMPYFFVGMMVVFALAWRREGVWVLSETAANHLGVLIAVAAVGWIVWQMPRSENDLISGGVNWPAGLLPHLGPLLMILLAVKLQHLPGACLVCHDYVSRKPRHRAGRLGVILLRRISAPIV